MEETADVYIFSFCRTIECYGSLSRTEALPGIRRGE